MSNKLDIINLNNEYLTQTFYKTSDYNIIDLSHKKSIIYYCDEKTLRDMDYTIKKNKTSKISYIGSGNFHYITYLLTKDIKKNFSLILFDNHTDTLKSEFNPYISCGSWVLNLLESNKYLDKVIMIGVDEKYKPTIPYMFVNKVEFLDKEDFFNREKFIYDLYNMINTEDIYVSIDKDVLRQEDAITNWDNGEMKLSELLYILKKLVKIKNTIGVDICGEGLKRESQSYEYETRKSISRNNTANFNILKTIIGPDN